MGTSGNYPRPWLGRNRSLKPYLSNTNPSASSFAVRATTACRRESGLCRLVSGVIWLRNIVVETYLIFEQWQILLILMYTPSIQQPDNNTVPYNTISPLTYSRTHRSPKYRHYCCRCTQSHSYCSSLARRPHLVL